MTEQDKEGNEGYPLRMIIDNLTDDQILDIMDEYAIEYHRHELKTRRGLKVIHWGRWHNWRRGSIWYDGRLIIGW